MLQDWIQTWFHWIELYGYLGVFVLMAMESSIFPVPSEIVVPPAAFLALHGGSGMSTTGVVVASTTGSLFGSLVTYAVARAAGRPFVERYGRFFLLPPHKITAAENLVTRFSAGGIFFSRLLPVVRHLCSIPAGLVRMPLVPFVTTTTTGAAIWCGTLTWFGQKVIGDRPELMHDPDALRHVLKEKLLWFVGAAVVLAGSYVLMKWATRRAAPPTPAGPPSVDERT